MYERNAIVLERYFDKLFGYDEKNSIKSNYSNYAELVSKIEKYQEACKEEDKIITDYDQVVNSIKDIQKEQQILYKKNSKLQENRNKIFENIDENIDTLTKRLEEIRQDTKTNNDSMDENGQKFILELNKFNDISVDRNQSSRTRRLAEGEYQKKLKDTISNINGISQEKVNEIKNFFKSENNIQQEVQEKIIKNGSKEKIPFNMEAIAKAIDLGTEIQEEETEIFCSVYDKTNRLLVEIKNDTIKIERHKKVIRDAESKLDFLSAVKDYLILFLYNERLNIVGGQKEHTKLMKDACDHLEQDLVQIKNLYNLLTKEISGRSTKKLYKDLYHSEYLYDLEEQEKEFENNISRLNVIGTVIYPDYWRLEGMQKIFESFKNSITNAYKKDLTEYEPILKYNDKIEELEEMEKDSIYDDIDFDAVDLDDEEEIIEEDKEDIDEEDDNYYYDFDDEIEDSSTEHEEVKEKYEENEEEIDQILGFYNFDKDLLKVDTKKDQEAEEDDIEEDEDYEYGFDEEDDGYDDINFDEEDNENNEEKDEDEESIDEEIKTDIDNSLNEDMFTYRGRKRKKK